LSASIPEAPEVPEVLGSRRNARRAAIAASVGTAIEWYDYALFGVAAGLVINPVFFPEKDGLVGLLAATATIAIGYAVRPIGGIVISNLGDRWGRRPTLMLTVILMSIGTVAIGLLPTPAQIGVLAPILLVVFRAVQGFGAGAELTGALTLVAEYYPGRRRGLMTGIANGSAGAGSVLATLAFLAVSQAPKEILLSWAWRIPFLLAGVLFLAAIWIRRNLEETPEYLAAMARLEAKGKAERRTPVVEAFRAQPGMVIRGFLIWCGHNCFAYLVTSFGVNYLITVQKMPSGDALLLSLIGSITFFFSSLFWAWLSDKVGHRRLLFTFAVVASLVITPYMLLLQTGRFWPAFLAMVVLGGFVIGMSQGTVGAVTTAMFPTEYRYSALTVGKEFNAAFVAGPTPLIAAALLTAGGGAPWLVIVFVVAMCLLTVLSMTMRRTTRERLQARLAADLPTTQTAAPTGAAALENEKGLA
jgi:MFS transporter, MHS family, shikimate and dehydroshikimate transport protein